MPSYWQSCELTNGIKNVYSPNPSLVTVRCKRIYMRYEQYIFAQIVLHVDEVNQIFTLRFWVWEIEEHWMYSNIARVGHLIESLSADSLKYSIRPIFHA